MLLNRRPATSAHSRQSEFKAAATESGTSIGRGHEQGGTTHVDSAVTAKPGKAMVRMKIFLSSVISGMEEYRAAARQAAETLGHTVTAAEDFGASPLSPQQVCLAGVRDADLVVLLLGER